MNNIAKLRKKRGISQKTLGEAIGVAQNTICNWENGNREPDNASILKLAEFFNVSTDIILGQVSNTKNPTTNEDRGIEDIKAALFGGDTEVTDEMWEELQEFIKFIKHKNQN